MEHRWYLASDMWLNSELLRAMQSACDVKQKVSEVFELLHAPVFRYLVRVLDDPSEAEDVMQEAFVQLYRVLHKGHVIEDVRPWIFRVAHNLAVDVLKKERGQITTDETTAFLITNRADGSLNPEESYSRRQLSTQMEVALSTLKPQHRQCFQMRAHGFRYKEIGLALGISEQRAAFIVKQVAVRLAAICG